jgi:hypothetical protein
MPKIEANRKGQRKYKKKQDNMHLDIVGDWRKDVIVRISLFSIVVISFADYVYSWFF